MRRRALRGARVGTGLLVVAVLSGCEQQVEEEAGVPSGLPICRVAQQVRSLPEEIDESSGVAASRTHSGVLWTHNDSGDPLLFAIDAGGTLLGRVAVPDAENTDWEDLGIGECDFGDCIYIADIGDNASQRSRIDLYRVPEPAPGDSVSRPAERFSMRYPNGPRDAEALLVLPGERVFVVTKGVGVPIELFEYPGALDPEVTATLRSVRTLSAAAVPFTDLVTGGGATPDGSWIALRTYTSVLLYRADDLIGGEPVTPARLDVTGFGEAQGEGIAILDNGAIILTSEGAQGGFPGSVGMLWCGLDEASAM